MSVIQQKNSIANKKEKDKIKSKLSGFIDSKQLNQEMDALLNHYGANSSQANLEKTRKILSKFSVNEELIKMREEK